MHPPDGPGQRLRRSPAAIPVAYIVGGVAAGAVMLLVDAIVPDAGTPLWLVVGRQTARSSLVGLTTSFLFVISVVFWVRIWAVQVTAGSLLSRVLSSFLTDRVQQHAMGFIIGGMAYTLTVLRAVPGNGGTGSVPHLAVSVAHLNALAVAVVIVLVIHNAARASQIGRLVHDIARDSVELIRQTHRPLGEGRTATEYDPPDVPAGPGHRVDADTSGWLRHVDEERLLGAVAPGSVVELAVRVGSFVMEGQRVVSVWSSEDVDEDALRASCSIAEDLSRRDSLAYGINELVDIAQRSMDASSSDSTSARDAVLRLGVVIRELLLHDLPATERRDEQDRRLIRRHDLGFGDYCEAAFGRIRDMAGDSQELLSVLLATIHEISDQLADRRLWDRCDLVREQAQLAMEQARHDLTLQHTIDHVASRARAAGVEPDRGDDIRPDP